MTERGEDSKGVGGHTHTHTVIAIQIYSEKYIFFSFSGAKIHQRLFEEHLATTVEDLGNLFDYCYSYHYYHHRCLLLPDIHQSAAAVAGPREEVFGTGYFQVPSTDWN